MKKKKIFYISILLYLVSMFLPVSEFDWGFIGLQAFFFGTSAISELDLFMIPWLANFTYLINLLLRNKNISIRILISVFTVVFSLFSLFYFKFSFQEKGMFDLNIGPSLIFWLSSFIVLLISQILEIKKPQKLH